MGHRHDENGAERWIEQRVGDQIIQYHIFTCSKCGKVMRREISGRRKA